MYVYSIESIYEGSELLHYYTLKEESGFHTPQILNKNLIGASLRGKVKEIVQDRVRININNDVLQTKLKWFRYVTPFSQPDGVGWYFMPEIGDEICLRFDSMNEDDAHVASAVHITHGNRMEPEIKSISTIYGQKIQYEPDRIILDDGSGSSFIIERNHGYTVNTDKIINIDAESHIMMAAGSNIAKIGEIGISLQKGESTVNINTMIDISSAHTRVQ
jgi:hypothetical protein